MAEYLTAGHTDALLEALESTGFPVGDGMAPKDYEEREDTDYPYVVLVANDTPWWRMTGPLDDSQADKDLVYSVISVGLNRAQAELMAEKVRAVLKPENVDIPGYRVQNLYFDNLGRADPDHDIRPSIWAIMDRVSLKTTPESD